MLNEKAKAIYEFIKDSINSGFPPTVREICNALDIKSTSTVHKYINLLVSEGYLEKMDNHNRAIKLKGGNNVSVPLVGDVAAGQPILAIENITEYINFNTDKNYSNSLFALKIKGDSMINIGIFNEDIEMCIRDRLLFLYTADAFSFRSFSLILNCSEEIGGLSLACTLFLL